MSELSEGPLSGYRVLELGSTIAGPFYGRLFADFGVDVIKIDKCGGQVGAETEEVLLNIASVSEAELHELVAEGVVFCAPQSH